MMLGEHTIPDKSTPVEYAKGSAPPVGHPDLPEVHEAGPRDAETLVLLHGLGGSWQIWTPLLPILERHFHVVAPTLPGHVGGEVLANVAGVTPATLTDQLVAQLRRLGVESAHVAGNSLGGWLALELARRGFARSVTALSPAGAWATDRDLKALIRGLLIPLMLMPLLRGIAWLFGGLASVRRGLTAQMMRHGERLSRSALLNLLRCFAGTRMMRPLFANAAKSGPIEPLAASQVPISIVWGTHDRVIPFAHYGQPLMKRIAGAHLTMVDAVGHVPMYDDPERIAQAIVANCARADRPSATGNARA
ncbi:MAG: alpha/beta fold hydrolase [Nevskiaceae bacterium]|nr:MAG: alpha/beta fold hydrolase [Nevskiaceae bacterium]TBR71877.1 MAG: alpha/beta fold hydrolase [Nevskiaceae bacterium]